MSNPFFRSAAETVGADYPESFRKTEHLFLRLFGFSNGTLPPQRPPLGRAGLRCTCANLHCGRGFGAAAHSTATQSGACTTARASWYERCLASCAIQKPSHLEESTRTMHAALKTFAPSALALLLVLPTAASAKEA
ncbi:hypothetical protein, partial [Pseudomonas juntendi]|uniref:hypothetical protein n=1 Tax=Pseudomonas juntendi TaxID=2666183 RepID=UPI0024493C63